MSFWQSPLLQNLQDGELPKVDVATKVTVDDASILKVGLILVLTVTIILAVHTIFKNA